MTAATLSTPKSGAYWALVGACGALLVCSLVFTTLFFLSGDDEILDAISNGQRITINPKSGEKTGTMRSLKPVAPIEATQHPTTSAPTEEIKKTPAFDVGTEDEVAPSTAIPASTTEPVSNALNKAAMVAAEDEAMNTIPVYPRTAMSLAAAPNPALLEKTQWGAIPIKSGETSAFEFYKRPFTAPTPRKAKLAIMVLNVGATKALAEQALALASDITIAYNPYAPNTSVWMESGRNMGHEAWLMLPTQAADFPASDPGALAQLLSAKPEDNAQRLEQTLARASGYVGVITAADSVLVDHVSHLTPILFELGKRGVALAAAAPSSDMAALKLQRGQSYSLVADIVLDEQLSPEAIAKQLAALEMLAAKNGKALGVVHATPLAITMLAQWQKNLAQKPFVLAPASALLAKE